MIGNPHSGVAHAIGQKEVEQANPCPACGGVDLVRKITTYPVLLSGPLEVSRSTLAVLLSTNA